MAGDQRSNDRRNGDKVLADKVETLITQMEDIANIRGQVGGDAAIKQRVIEHQQLMQDVPIIRGQVGEIIDVLDGEEHKDLSGAVWREGGMRDKMDVLYDDSQNGGIKVKLGAWNRVFVALIGFAGAIIGALIVASGQ